MHSCVVSSVVGTPGIHDGTIAGIAPELHRVTDRVTQHALLGTLQRPRPHTKFGSSLFRHGLGGARHRPTFPRLELGGGGEASKPAPNCVELRSFLNL